MALITRSRPLAALVLLGAALLAARSSEAGCSIIDGDRDGNGTADVRIVGDALRHAVVAEIHNDGSYLISVDCNNNGSFADAIDVVRSAPGPVESYIFELVGSDTLTINQTDDLVGALRHVVVAMGGISNTVTFHSQGHAILAGSDVAFDLIGSPRSDTVTLDFTGSAVASSVVSVRGDMTFDQDHVTVKAPASVTDSNFDVLVDLGPGFNSFSWDDNGGTLTNSNLAVEVQGSDVTTETDLVTTRFAGSLESNSRADFNVRLNSGDDQFIGTFDVSTYGVDKLGASGSEARYYVNGGPGFDRLQVSDAGTPGAAVDNGLIDIRLEGYLQPDTLTLDWHGLTGSGTYRFRATGGDASDVVVASLATDPASTNVIDALVSTDSEGDISFFGDTAYLGVVDRGGSASPGPAGAVIVDGGLDGTDYCAYFGTLPHLAFNCEAGTY